MSESKSIISLVRVYTKARSSYLIFDVVLVIFYVRSNSMPTDIIRLSEILAETRHFHTEIVQAVWFSKINYVEPNLAPFFSITNSKKEPLCMAVRVDIVL